MKTNQELGVRYLKIFLIVIGILIACIFVDFLFFQDEIGLYSRFVLFAYVIGGFSVLHGIVLFFTKDPLVPKKFSSPVTPLITMILGFGGISSHFWYFVPGIRRSCINDEFLCGIEYYAPEVFIVLPISFMLILSSCLIFHRVTKRKLKSQ